MLGKVLFFGRKNCSYSKKLKIYLKGRCRKFSYVESSFVGEKISVSKFNEKNFDYIFCFRSFYILKKNLLNKCKKAAINFHPGTPKYRGIGCINFALLNDEKYYGSTAHIINSKIDSGRIIDVRRFKINNNDNVKSCLKKTYKIMLKQAVNIIKLIIKQEKILTKLIKKNTKVKWSKKFTTKKDLERIYLINKSISKKRLMRLIRATNTELFKPYMILHGKKFYIND